MAHEKLESKKKMIIKDDLKYRSKSEEKNGKVQKSKW